MRPFICIVLAALAVLSLGDFASCRSPNDYLAIADQPSPAASPSTSLPSEAALDPLDPSNGPALAAATPAYKTVRVAVPYNCGPRGCSVRYEYRQVPVNPSDPDTSGPYVVDPVADPISTPTYQAASSGPLRSLLSRVRGRFRTVFARLGSRLRGGC